MNVSVDYKHTPNRRNNQNKRLSPIAGKGVPMEELLFSQAGMAVHRKLIQINKHDCRFPFGTL